MVEHSLTSAMQRRIGVLRRVAELAVVLFLILTSTLINVSFGWVALFFSAPLDPARDRPNSVPFPATIETSKEF